MGGRHGCAPKRHHTIAHVFVDRALMIAADDVCQATEQAIEQHLQLCRVQAFRQFGEATHVAKHHGEFTGCGFHRIAFGVFGHFIDQLWWDVGAKQMHQFPLGAALHKVAVTHVQPKCRDHHEETGGQWQDQARLEVEPKVQSHDATEYAQGQHHRTHGRQQREGDGQQETDTEHDHQVVTHRVVGFDQHAPVQYP